ncbi:MAG TPA: ubiquinol oxidase subunit II [Roseiarcus sp.]|nr:ubiquinol oxidase subunit II [Roseiarcus sp.]
MGGFRGRAAGRLAVVAALAVNLSGCEWGVLDPKGPVGAADRTILIDSVAIMLAIVIPTIIATLAFAWWFRASNPRARHLPDFVYSGRVELVVWSIPLLTIILLGGVTWIGAHELDPAKPLASSNKPLPIQVVSLDWKWLFIYPEQKVAVVNRLVAPVGVPLQMSLTSSSVMNVFFVPQLGSMIYTMNGMTVHLNLEADQPGVYHGLSAHFSGDGFSDMHFDVQAISPADFTAWAQQSAAANQALDAKAYQDLAKQSANVPPTIYRLADENLFDDIVTQKLPPGPGPQTGQPSPAVKPH